MDKCHINDKVIEQYLFGRLEEDEETAFQQHLFACENCSAKVQRLRRLAEAFHPENIEREEKGEIGETGRIVPFVRKISPWLAAASIVLVFVAGWFAGRYHTHVDQQLAGNVVQTQTDSLPEYASSGSATKKEFSFISPGEGRYAYNINETFSDENNIMFKWSPKTSNALLIIKTDDGLWDEIRVKDTDHIKVNMTIYSAYRSVTWFLIVSESEEALKGVIDLRKKL